jgi:malate dehydrogenase
MKISIIGASGIVGSCTAFAIADQGLADEIVLLGNSKPNVAACHAIDIQASVTGCKEMTVRPGTYKDIAGSDIVIIAAGIHFPASVPVIDKLKANIPIIKEIAGQIEYHCPQAIVIIATNPVDLLNYSLFLSTSLERRQCIGFNLNDTTRFRMILAKSLGLSATRIEAHVLGEHPRAPLLIFSSVRVDGEIFAVGNTLRNKVETEIGNYLGSFEALQAGRTSGWTTASGIALMVKAIVGDSGALLDCSAVLDREYGYHDISLGVPAIISREGVRQITELKLTDNELRELKNIAGVLQENCALVRSLVGSKRK